MGSLYEAFERGGAAGREQRRRRTLSQHMQTALAGDQDALKEIYRVDADDGLRTQQLAQQQTQQTAKAAQDEFQRYSRLLTSAPDPMRQQMYTAWRDRAIKAGLPADMPEAYEEGALKVAQAVASGSTGANPYSELPSDIQSLRLLSENPDLAKLDRERRQYSGMVPKPFETSQGIGWGAPGGGITLAPINGVGGQPASQPQPQPSMAPPRIGAVSDSDPVAKRLMAYSERLRAMNLPPAQQQELMTAYEQEQNVVPTPDLSAPTQQPARGGAPNIAQPYEKKDTPPAGYERKPDGTMGYIVGGPADPMVISQRPLDPAKKMKLEQTKRKEIASLDALDTKIDQTVALIDTLLEGRRKFGGVTGMGATVAKIPGSPWADLSAKLDTLKARSIFGALQEMRSNSPTGGALGSTTEKELGMLGNSETQLQQSQSPEALEAGLRAYRKNLVDSKTRLRRGVEDFYETEGGGINAPATQSNPQIDSLLEKYR